MAFPVKCPCGVTFFVMPYQVKAGAGKHCSRKCAFANRKKKPMAERFWTKVNKLPGDGCWNWTAHIGPGAYGSFGMGGRNATILAHRASWIIHFGEIPAGMNVLHKCDNGACVRPDHLFLGDQQDNVDDMISKGRSNFTGARRLTPDQVLNIKSELGTATDATLAKRYGVAESTILRIRTGVCWAWLS